MQATVRSFDPGDRTGSVFLDDGTALAFGAEAFDAGGLRLVRPGQRVNLRMSEGRIAVVTLATFAPPDPAAAH